MGDRASAVRFYNQALTAANDKTNEQAKALAFQLFSSAILADPTWHFAWYMYGNVCMDQQLREAAVAAWRRALDCDPPPEDRAKILTNFAWGLHELNQFAEAFQYGKEALALAPNEPHPHVNISRTYAIMGDTASAVRHAKRARELAPDDSVCKMNLAFNLLFDRQLAAGFDEMEAKYQYRLKNFLQYPYPVWEGEPDKTVFLVADQGLGDTLSFARLIPYAARKVRFLHVYIQGELMRLFQHAFARLSNINLIPMQNNNVPFPHADAWTTFVSLPYALKLTDEEIRDAPGIDVPVYGMPTTWRVPDRALHVGIAWAGSPLNDIDRHRSIPFKHFLELFRAPEVQFYSLQLGPPLAEMHAAGAAGLVKDLSPYIRDVCDTVALLQHLDLVIGCESALGHICAAIDKEFWCAYSFAGRDWRIGCHGDDRFWCPHHRIFQQGIDCRWEPVFSKMAHELKVRLAEKQAITEVDNHARAAASA